MARYTASLDTPQPAEETFDYMADFANSHEWDPAIVESTRAGGDGPIGVGSEFRLRYRMLGTTTELCYRIVEYDRPNRVAFECENGPFAIRDEIAVAAQAAGARLTYDATVAPKGPLKLADPLLQLGFRRAGDRALAGLRRVMNG